ncbi:MAG TPA: hypothetical protein VIN09_12065 [Chloroflexota bacterium]
MRKIGLLERIGLYLLVAGYQLLEFVLGALRALYRRETSARAGQGSKLDGGASKASAH